MSRLFGTDGVRGEANLTLTAPLALNLGMAAGKWAVGNAAERGIKGRPLVIVGRDTRLSGDMLEAALTAGFASVGVDSHCIGEAPTPAVARIALALNAALGAVISASHNPFHDNGIKFFGHNGKKLPDAVEDDIAEAIPLLDTLSRPAGAAIGRIMTSKDELDLYSCKVKATLEGNCPLKGMKLVVDCANGAAFKIAPSLLRELGAEVVEIFCAPNGLNINVECGSTHPAALAAAVKDLGATAGLAFDGDADRVILADEQGQIVDGDRIMAILALQMQQDNTLPGQVVVATIMSNAGLERALEAKGIRLHRTDVGDRYVAEAMEQLGAALGGEQSGHILLPGLTPTGDGLVTALQALNVMRITGRPLSELAGVVQTCPQLLRNVRLRDRQSWRDDLDLQSAIARGKERLGKPEWLSVRPSGTEPLLRVMAQGPDREAVEAVVHEICAVAESRLG